MLDNHQRRRSQLQKLVEDAKVQLDDHHSGRKLMETEEYEKIKKRVGLYEQKINRMGETLDEDVSSVSMMTSMDATFCLAEHNLFFFCCCCCYFCESLLRPRKSCEPSSEKNKEWNSVVAAASFNEELVPQWDEERCQSINSKP